ncbi:MAG: extracellular solute-binding protein [Pseudomonadota bacterium]
MRSTPRATALPLLRGLPIAVCTLSAVALATPTVAQETASETTTQTQDQTGASQNGGAQEAASASDASTRKWHHGMTLGGPLKYGPDFKHFDWAKPDTPKGGSIRRALIGSFDNLNGFTFRGDIAPFGTFLVQETLMARSLDEPSAQYGLIAESATWPADFSSATYRLRPEARFQDGEPIKPEDVIFSLDALKESHPTYFGKYWKNVVKAEKTGPHEVKFTFDVKNNRELPHIMGDLFVLPKHWWTANGADGKPRDVKRTTLEPILGSGPYRYGEIKAGRSIVYERDPNYWGRDLPVNIGQWNFDQIITEYYRDQNVAFEAFKSGRLDYYPEGRSKEWVNAYDFEAVKKGWVKKLELRVEGVEFMTGLMMNTRREIFKDRRVRQAFNYALDFEWLNKNLFYGKRKRKRSYWDQSELGSSESLPTGRELEILEELRGDIPDEVFTEVFTNPVNDSPQAVRANLRKANDLLAEAGWKIRTEEIDDPDCGFFCGLMRTVGLQSAETRRVLRNEAGKQFNVEILLGSPTLESVMLNYQANLRKLGINASIRIVDSAQYANRIKDFDFDMVPGSFPQSSSPGNEQRDMFSTDAADASGSRNLPGIKNPAVDKLIDKIIFAKDRKDLVTVTNAMDRVLLHNHYVVPFWYTAETWVATWDRYGRPDPNPEYAIRAWQTWWLDKEKAAKLAEARG